MSNVRSADDYTYISQRLKQIHSEESASCTDILFDPAGIDVNKTAGLFAMSWYDTYSIRKSDYWQLSDELLCSDDFNDELTPLINYIKWLDRSNPSDILITAYRKYSSKLIQHNIKILVCRMRLLHMI